MAEFRILETLDSNPEMQNDLGVTVWFLSREKDHRLLIVKKARFL